MTIYFAGIDPGRSGGIAIVSDYDSEVYTHKMPETLDDLQSLLGAYQENLGFCLIEKIHAYSLPFDPTKNRIIKLGFDKLMKQQGMILATAAIILGKERVGEVVPAKWQRALMARSRGDKKVTLARARELYPKIKVRHWNADALLIATACRRWHGPRNSTLKDWKGI
jgi:pseudouridine-5'-phosphate glycosidase